MKIYMKSGRVILDGNGTLTVSNNENAITVDPEINNLGINNFHYIANQKGFYRKIKILWYIFKWMLSQEGR